MSKHGWTYKKLGEVCVSDLGKTLNQSKDKGNFRPYLCAINIQWDKIDLSLLKETRFEDDELDKYSVVKGDLLVCEGGDVGRAAIWNDSNPIYYQNALHRVRFNSQMSARFCLYFLYHLKLTGELDNKYSKGVTIKHLVKSSLLSIPIPVPEMAEQEAIVAELDEINEAIAALQQQVADLDTLAQATFYEMFGDPVTNPKGWPTKKFSDCFKLSSGHSLTAKNFIDGPYPIYGGNGIAGYHNTFNLSGNNIIIGRVGALCGNVRNVIGEVFVTDNAFILFQKIACNNVFLVNLLNIYNLRQYAREAMQPVISNSTLKNIPIILPPMERQQEFAERVEAIEAAKTELSAQIAEMQTLLASRMDFWFAPNQPGDP